MRFPGKCILRSLDSLASFEFSSQKLSTNCSKRAFASPTRQLPLFSIILIILGSLLKSSRVPFSDRGKKEERMVSRKEFEDFKKEWEFKQMANIALQQRFAVVEKLQKDLMSEKELRQKEEKEAKRVEDKWKEERREYEQRLKKEHEAGLMMREEQLKVMEQQETKWKKDHEEREKRWKEEHDKYVRMRDREVEELKGRMREKLLVMGVLATDMTRKEEGDEEVVGEEGKGQMKEKDGKEVRGKSNDESSNSNGGSNNSSRKGEKEKGSKGENNEGGNGDGRKERKGEGKKGDSEHQRGVCYGFRDNGRCKFGESCKFTHSARGEDRKDRGGGGECYEYERGGWCKWGENCKFRHGGRGREMGGQYGRTADKFPPGIEQRREGIYAPFTTGNFRVDQERIRHEGGIRSQERGYNMRLTQGNGMRGGGGEGGGIDGRGRWGWERGELGWGGSMRGSGGY